MSSSLISVWKAKFKDPVSAIVLPDGCRDVIVKIVGDEKPIWSVSPLFDRSELVQIKANSECVGFRLRPGSEIKEAELLSYIESKRLHIDEVKNCLDDFITTDESVQEALACCAIEIGSVTEISAQLGVSVRTLQRLLSSKTNRNPGYWLQLARIRKAARCLDSSVRLVDVAEDFGFSDQAHMTREFQRWFGLTPLQFLNSPSVTRQLNENGYA